MSEPKQRYTVSPTKPTKPPTGPAPTPPPGPTINGEPLSTKQLHELITSQAITIDRLYERIGKLQMYLEIEKKVNLSLQDTILDLEEKLK